MGAGRGWGGGEHHNIIIREQGLQGQAPTGSDFFFCVFGFKTGGNAARFQKKKIGSIRSLNFFLKKLGSIRCFPNISMIQGQAQNLCYFSLFFYLKTGGNAARFQKNTFWVHSILEIFVQKKNWVHSIFESFALKIGSIRCLPTLSMNKGFKDRLRVVVFCPCFCVKTGGNAARFSKTLKFFLKKLGSNRWSLNKGFKDRLRICVIYLCFFYFKTGGNAARFQKNTFWVHSILEIFIKKKLGPFDLWKFCLKNWVHPMSSESFHEQGLQGQGQSSFLVFVFTSKQGEMLPVFQKDFLGPFDLWIFSFKKLGSNRCFPKLSMNKGFKDRLRICVIYLCFFAFKTGGNAARFSTTFFGPFRSLKFLLLQIGSSMNKGFKDRLRVFVFVFAFTSKQGEMLPVFQKTTLGVHLIFEIFPFKTLGSIRCFPRLSMNKGFKDRLRICVICLCFCFKTGGNAARFSKTFFGPFRSLKFLHLKIGSSMNKGSKDRVRVLFCLCFYLKTGGNAARFSKKTFGSIRSLKCFL